MSKAAAYFTLLGAVYDSLPKNFDTAFVKADESNTPAGRVKSVGTGHTKDLGLLVKIVTFTLPDFEIPAEILTVNN